MIYAQRPEATACAEWDFWNQRMRRYIRRGSKGIALIDTSQGRPVLRYVFDVSDTGRMDNGLNPNLWQYRPEHGEVVGAALEGRFEVSRRSWKTSHPGWQRNIGTAIKRISSVSLTARSWRGMIRLTPARHSAAPPLSASPIPCCPAVVWTRMNTSGMRIS